MSEPLVSTVPSMLYHYTTQVGLMGIVESKEIWATQIEYLNDGMELIYAFDLAMQVLYFYRDRPSADGTVIDDAQRLRINDLIDLLQGRPLALRVFVASFSENPDVLSQWRAYGRPGDAFSIGFPGAALVEAAQSAGWRFEPVVYAREVAFAMVETTMRPMLDSLASGRDGSDVRAEVQQLMFDLGPILKTPAFEEEREWRLISPPIDGPGRRFRPGKYSIIPYRAFALPGSEAIGGANAKIWIGPGPHRELSIRSLSELLREYEMPCQLQWSGASYRDW